MAVALDTPVQYVKGVGPRAAAVLAPKNINTVEDLLHHFPFRYEDRQQTSSISDLQVGEVVSVIGEVIDVGAGASRARVPMFELVLRQGSDYLKCVWFNAPYLKDLFAHGQRVVVYGKVESDGPSQVCKMIQPQYEVLDDEEGESGALDVGRIVPVYESLSGNWLTTRWQKKVIFNLLDALRGAVPEHLPRALRERVCIPDRETSLREAHFPPEECSLSELAAGKDRARRRLVFEEFFFLQLGLAMRRREMGEQKGIAFDMTDAAQSSCREILPFKLTKSQKEAMSEIIEDMKRPHPMRRLLQGDVGSGKTIISVLAMVIAIENGYQAMLMAPTEILATQHYLSIKKMLTRSGRNYRVELLTGSMEESRKRKIRRLINCGEVQMVIGTHALIEKSTAPPYLGLCVIDEQHRFGVLQRAAVMNKPGLVEADTLVMSATPIPRSLLLAAHGDLAVSCITELPPGRTPITTMRLKEDQAEAAWDFIAKEVDAGHQAYILYPVIEGSSADKPELDFCNDADEDEDEPQAKAPAKKQPAANGQTGLKSAVEMYEYLEKGPFSDMRVELLHGKMATEVKEDIMRRFQAGEVDVLVATTVIEVGVDVPNATVMMVENAERFGLASLHQIRGRVGRGPAASYCLLMTGARVGRAGDARLDAMVRTQDGFDLAETDLELRGPGEFFGTRQAGVPDFRVADLVRDRRLLEIAKVEAAGFLADGGGATDVEREKVWARLRAVWQRRYGLVEVG